MHGSELIIRSQNQEQICELLPIHALHDDFPSALVQDYAHWLDKRTDLIEWRSLKDPWTSSPNNWIMRANDQGGFVLSHRTKKVIDVRSPTARLIINLLGPLEHATHIHIILEGATRAVEIHLPRKKLDFFVKEPGISFESK